MFWQKICHPIKAPISFDADKRINKNKFDVKFSTDKFKDLHPNQPKPVTPSKTVKNVNTRNPYNQWRIYGGGPGDLDLPPRN